MKPIVLIKTICTDELFSPRLRACIKKVNGVSFDVKTIDMAITQEAFSSSDQQNGV